MTPPSVCVVMPAYNEAEGIGGFLREIHVSLRPVPHTFVVVDDASSDATPAVLASLVESGLSVTGLRNARNRGHGPSTLRALRAGVSSGADVVIAVDGDGQFHGPDIPRILEAVASGADLADGVRQYAAVPAYRRTVSACTRLWVRSRCGTWPSDANTPLRAYRRDVLLRLLQTIPGHHLTPNLMVSALSRSWGLSIAEIPVTCRDRRGVHRTGTSWGATTTWLPSARFMRFCITAGVGLLGAASRSPSDDRDSPAIRPLPDIDLAPSPTTSETQLPDRPRD